MKKLSILLSLCLALALGGCSMLREEAAPAEEDRLVGIYVTPEYIDTFDFEAYFEDNASQLLSGGGGEISAEDAEEYSQRIYATNNGAGRASWSSPSGACPSSARATARARRVTSPARPAPAWRAAALT